MATADHLPVQLILALSQDAERRASILDQEVSFLIATLRFRVPANGDLDESTPEMLFDSQRGPILHLQASAAHLHWDVRAAANGAEYARKLVESFCKYVLQGHSFEATVGTHLLLVVNALRNHLSGLAGQLGELHSRVEQVLKYSIPDHPATSVRGLRDSTLLDRYLAEKSRQVYRDLARFVAAPNLLNSSYPFESTPRVYVTRLYEAESSLMRFASPVLQSDWVAWHWQDMQVAPNEKGVAPIRDEARPPESFVAIRMPFWLPDSLELVPVIGHELAHAVISDVCGGIKADSWIDADSSAFPSLMRAIATRLDATVVDLQESGARTHAQELTADVLALARFRGGFLYAAASLTLANEALSGFATDAYKQSRICTILGGLASDAKSEKLSDIEQLQRLNALLVSTAVRSTLLGNTQDALLKLARLSVLARLAPEIESCAHEAGSQHNEQFADTKALAVDVLACVRMIRGLFAIDNPAYSGIAFDSLVDSIVSILGGIDENGVGPNTKCVFLSACSNFWADAAKPVSGAAPYQLSPGEAEYFLWRQRISTDVVNLLAPSLSVQLTLGQHLQDVAWRTRWREATPRDAAWCAENRNASLWPKKAGSLATRTEFRILLDDYLFRTVSPAPLFDLLNKRALPIGAKGASAHTTFRETYPAAKPPGASNSLNPSRHMTGCFFPALELRNYVLTGKSVKDVDFLRNRPFPHWDREQLVGNTHPIAAAQRLGMSLNPAFVLTLFLTHTGTVVAKHLLSEAGGGGSAAVLLGRYDAMTLVRAEHSEVPFAPTSHSPLAAVVQRRSLIARHNGPAPKLENVLATTFIALSSPLAWRIFAWWCDSSPRILSDLNKQGIKWHLFLSDGWEQVVMMYSYSPAAGEVSPKVDGILAALEAITKHPVVGRTETLFTTRMFDMSPGTDYELSIRFRCRSLVGSALRAEAVSDAINRQIPDPAGTPSSPKFIQSNWESEFPDGPAPIVRIVSGLTDYEVRLAPRDVAVESSSSLAERNEKTLKAAKAVHQRLNRCESLVNRLITQVAFGKPRPE